MKRTLYSILSLVALAMIAWLSAEITATIHARKATAERIARLPSIEVTGLDGRRLYASAKLSRPTILLFFRTTCSYCRDEIADLVAHHAMFDQTSVLLVSGEPPGILRRFSQELEITKRTDFTVAVDEQGKLAKHYSIRKIPAVFVYDSGGALLRRFEGLASAAVMATSVRSDPSFDARHAQVP